MSFQQLGVAALAFIGAVNAASSCCFVVQDEAQEVYWSEWKSIVYTGTVTLTSITTFVTPYPTTTITRYETHVYPIEKILTTSSLVTDNPVSLYTNPTFAIPQKTEILDDKAPTNTGGVVIASPTGFWVYHTVRVFAAPAVTDLDGNVACGTVSSFTNVASSAAACIPTFSGINSYAAAYYDSGAGGVEISLTTPFIHVPTRTDLQISPTEACVQGDGIENYGYPVQQLINHLAGNELYSAQYPGIESCIPAGPSIKAAKLLAVTVIDAVTTDTASGDLTSSTEVTVSPTSSSITTTTSSTSTSSTTSSLGTTSTTSTTSTSLPSAVPDSTTSDSIPIVTDTALPGGLLPDTSSSTSTTTSLPPVPQSAITSESSDTSISSETPSETSSEIPSEATSSASEVTSEAASSLSSILVFTSDTLLSSGNIGSTVITSSSTEEPAAVSTTAASESSLEPTTEISTQKSSPGVVSTTATGLVTDTPLPASAGKECISWGLLTGFMGLVIFRVY